MPRKPPPKDDNVVPINPADRPAPKSGRKTPPRGGHQANPKRIEVAERRAQALQLRHAGLTFDRIAKAISKKYDLGDAYTRASAYRDVREGLDQIIEEPARELLEEELSRLMAAQAAIWTKVIDGDLKAIDRLLRIMDRRSRYLGLDSPIKQQLTGPDGSPLLAINLTDPEELMREGLAIVEEQVAAKKARRAPRAASE